MDEPELTRANISSHLQKFRLHHKRRAEREISNQQFLADNERFEYPGLTSMLVWMGVLPRDVRFAGSQQTDVLCKPRKEKNNLVQDSRSDGADVSVDAVSVNGGTINATSVNHGVTGITPTLNGSVSSLLGSKNIDATSGIFTKPCQQNYDVAASPVQNGVWYQPRQEENNLPAQNLLSDAADVSLDGFSVDGGTSDVSSVIYGEIGSIPLNDTISSLLGTEAIGEMSAGFNKSCRQNIDGAVPLEQNNIWYQPRLLENNLLVQNMLSDGAYVSLNGFSVNGETVDVLSVPHGEFGNTLNDNVPYSLEMENIGETSAGLTTSCQLNNDVATPQEVNGVCCPLRGQVNNLLAQNLPSGRAYVSLDSFSVNEGIADVSSVAHGETGNTSPLNDRVPLLGMKNIGGTSVRFTESCLRNPLEQSSVWCQPSLAPNLLSVGAFATLDSFSVNGGTADVPSVACGETGYTHLNDSFPSLLGMKHIGETLAGFTESCQWNNDVVAPLEQNGVWFQPRRQESNLLARNLPSGGAYVSHNDFLVNAGTINVSSVAQGVTGNTPLNGNIPLIGTENIGETFAGFTESYQQNNDVAAPVEQNGVWYQPRRQENNLLMYLSTAC